MHAPMKPPNGMIPLAVPNISGREAEYLAECVKTTFVSTVGEFVTRFEKMVASAAGTPEAVATCSGHHRPSCRAGGDRRPPWRSRDPADLDLHRLGECDLACRRDAVAVRRRRRKLDARSRPPRTRAQGQDEARGRRPDPRTDWPPRRRGDAGLCTRPARRHGPHRRDRPRVQAARHRRCGGGARRDLQGPSLRHARGRPQHVFVQRQQDRHFGRRRRGGRDRQGADGDGSGISPRPRGSGPNTSTTWSASTTA